MAPESRDRGENPLHREAVRQVVLGLLAGLAVNVGAILARSLDDPYSGPRLTVRTWLDKRARGGEA